MLKSVVFVAFYFGSLVAEPQSKGTHEMGEIVGGLLVKFIHVRDDERLIVVEERDNLGSHVKV